MANDWIEHCKKYQKEHNLSWRDTLKEAKTTYKTTTGGNVISNIIYNNPEKFDINKIKNPSENLIKKFGAKKEKKSLKNFGITKPSINSNKSIEEFKNIDPLILYEGFKRLINDDKIKNLENITHEKLLELYNPTGLSLNTLISASTYLR